MKEIIRFNSLNILKIHSIIICNIFSTDYFTNLNFDDFFSPATFCRKLP